MKYWIGQSERENERELEKKMGLRVDKNI